MDSDLNAITRCSYEKFEKREFWFISLFMKTYYFKTHLMQFYNIILKDNGYNKEARDLNKLYAQKEVNSLLMQNNLCYKKSLIKSS